MIAVSCMACHEARAPLEPWVYEMPEEPPEGHVDVEVSHCGVCGSDCHQLADAWGAACFPLVPGHEVVGHVRRLGRGVERFELGRRVGIGPQRSSCCSCPSCNAGLEHICPLITKAYAGPGKDKGGFARTIRFPVRWAFAIPEDLPSELAAPLLCAGITTFAPLKRHCRPGMRVGVVGVGGLGHVALQFARAMGCAPVAISKGEAKRQDALAFGAEAHLVSSDTAQMAQAKATLDVILNTASGAAELDSYLALLKPRGIMVCVGLPEKEQESMTKLFLHSLVLQEKTLVGSYLGPHSDYDEMLAFAVAHGVRPQVELLPLEEANAAVERVRQGAARYRMVLTT